MLQRVDGRVRVERHARLHARGANTVQRGVQVWARFAVHGERVGAQGGHGGDVFVDPNRHQVHVARFAHATAHAGDDGLPQRNGVHKPPVHDVDMKRVDAGLAVDRVDVTAQIREIGRQNASRYGDPVSTAHGLHAGRAAGRACEALRKRFLTGALFCTDYGDIVPRAHTLVRPLAHPPCVRTRHDPEG